MPQLDPAKAMFLAQLFWLALSFLVLYVVVAFYITPRLNDIFSTRRSIVEGDLEKAEQLKNQTDTILAQYDTKIESAKKLSAKSFEDARLKLLKSNDDSKMKHAAQLAEQISAAEVQIAAQRAKALESIQSTAAELTSDAIVKITGYKESAKSIQTALQAAS